jgi:protein-arginine kinase activator protein McsA
MLCAKCHQREATLHFRTVVNGTEEEAVHLCKDCAPPLGFDLDKLDPKQIEALSVIGKKCEFCGGDAFSGAMRVGGGAIYWCFDCGLEFASIFQQLLVAERPYLLQRSEEESSFLSICSDTDLQAWSAAANEKAVQTLKERRRKDGRDKGS